MTYLTLFFLGLSRTYSPNRSTSTPAISPNSLPPSGINSNGTSSSTHSPQIPTSTLLPLHSFSNISSSPSTSPSLSLPMDRSNLRLLPYSLLLVALIVAMSRLIDYRHHWQDVFVGGIVGIISALIGYWWYFSSLFSLDSGREKSLRWSKVISREDGESVTPVTYEFL